MWAVCFHLGLLGLMGFHQPDMPPWPGSEGIPVRAVVATVVVLGLLIALSYLLKRGAFGWRLGPARIPVTVEATVPLGERRSLVIVTVEGRRMLLGLTPMQVSLVAELSAGTAAFSKVLDHRREVSLEGRS